MKSQFANTRNIRVVCAAAVAAVALWVVGAIDAHLFLAPPLEEVAAPQTATSLEVASRQPAAEDRPAIPSRSDAVPTAQNLLKDAPPSPSPRRALTNSRQPYPEMLALHARGKPGDYTVIQYVVRECTFALQTGQFARDRGLLTGNMSPIPISGREVSPVSALATPSIHAQRVRALQEIETRCLQLGKDLRLYEPHPGDAFGRTIAALDNGSHREQNTTLLLEALKAQGAAITDDWLQLEVIRRQGSEFSEFSGEKQLIGLTVLVNHAVQNDPATPGNSLRELALCVGYGQCGLRIEELDLSYYDLPKGSPQHTRALQLLPRLLELFRM